MMEIFSFQNNQIKMDLNWNGQISVTLAPSSCSPYYVFEKHFPDSKLFVTWMSNQNPSSVLYYKLYIHQNRCLKNLVSRISYCFFFGPEILADKSNFERRSKSLPILFFLVNFEYVFRIFITIQLVWNVQCKFSRQTKSYQCHFLD